MNESTTLLLPSRRRGSISRFGNDVESEGIKPSEDSISNIPQVLENWHKRSMFSQAEHSNEIIGGHRRSLSDSGGTTNPSSQAGGHQRARSFVQFPDGSVSALTPLDMGRQELYQDIPFLAVPGLQKKEHSLSVAFSSFASAIDVLEQDKHLASTTGKGMNPEEKEKRLSQMSLLLLDELEADAITVTTPLISAVLASALLMFNAGYNISVMNAPEPFVFPGHSTMSWSIAVSAFCVGGPIGASLAGTWADNRGRRGALLLTTWLFIIGGIIQSFAPSMLVITISRVIVGLASAASTVLVPIYLGELAPPNLRGVIGTMTQFAMVLGILFADIVGLFFANDSKWRWMFSLTTIMGFGQLLLTPFLLESPRWLLERNSKSSKARFIIKKLRGFRYDDEVETEVDFFISAAKTQSVNGDSAKSQGKNKKNPITEMFADKSVRLLVVSTLVLQVGQQLSGINAVFYYSGLFFDGVLDDPLVGTTIIGAINVLATFVALLLMDKCGRRTLIMWSAGGMFISCIIIVMSLLGYFSSNYVALFGVGAYVSFFEIGLGPIPWLIVAEMFDGKYVTAAMTVSSQVNWTCNFFVGLLFPYLNKNLGAFSFVPFAVVILLIFIYSWKYLPETAGTTPAELQAQLVEKNKDVTYHNMDIHQMSSSAPPSHDEWMNALKELESEGELPH